MVPGKLVTSCNVKDFSQMINHSYFIIISLMIFACLLIFISWIGRLWMYCVNLQMLGKSKSLFIKEYNQRLFNWLVAFSLVMVVVGRFIIKFILIEMGAWILFIFLETYTRMFWSAESLYYNPIWHFIVATWETVVYSPILDLDR